MCRLCRLSLQVWRGKTVVTRRQTRDSCRQQKWACATCGKRDFKLQLCEGCKCARYCNHRCQKHDWKNHKSLCKLLRHKQPLSFVYSWKLEQARRAIIACERWDLVQPVRYVRCATAPSVPKVLEVMRVVPGFTASVVLYLGQHRCSHWQHIEESYERTNRTRKYFEAVARLEAGKTCRLRGEDIVSGVTAFLRASKPCLQIVTELSKACNARGDARRYAPSGRL